MKCKRCGWCCKEVGLSFFIHSQHPIIRAMPNLDWTLIEDGVGPCAMLTWEKGKATCLLQKYLGYAAKPDVCRDYPDGDEKCFLKQEK